MTNVRLLRHLVIRHSSFLRHSGFVVRHFVGESGLPLDTKPAPTTQSTLTPSPGRVRKLDCNSLNSQQSKELNRGWDQRTGQGNQASPPSPQETGTFRQAAE